MGKRRRVRGGQIGKQGMTGAWADEMTAELRLVGMGEIQAGRGEEDFSCVGIGSGVVIAIYDAKKRVGACGHFILPAAPPGHDRSRPGKYVNTGVAQAIDEMLALGATAKNLRGAIIGGAQLFVNGNCDVSHGTIGARNVEAALRVLAEYGVSCRAKDVGGREGRTVTFSGSDGTVKVRHSLDSDRVLCNLRG